MRVRARGADRRGRGLAHPPHARRRTADRAGEDPRPRGGAGPGARRVRAHRRADRGAVRGGTPGGARRRPLLGADRRRRRRARRDPRAGAAGAVAQPGEHRGHRGGAGALPGHAAGGGVRHRLPRRDAAARLALRAAPRPGGPAADPPVRLPRDVARLRRAPGGGAPGSSARRAGTGDPAPGQRVQCGGGRGRAQRRHVDGADPARRLGDGHAQRRPGSRDRGAPATARAGWTSTRSTPCSTRRAG